MSVRMSPEHATGVLFENFTVLSPAVPDWFIPRNLRVPKVPPKDTGSVRPASGIRVHSPLFTEYSKPDKSPEYSPDLTNANSCSLSAVNVMYSISSSAQLASSSFPGVTVAAVQSVTETEEMVRA